LLFDAIDDTRWSTIVITGPSQSSKTLCGFAIPTIRSICEAEENVVLGIPEGDMADDKYKEDIYPVMSNSPRLRRYLPVRGPGSSGGKVRDAIEFSNGVRAKIMTRGGQDTGKAGYTARVVYITEAAGWSYATTTSSEGDVFRQLRARQFGYSHKERQMIVEGTTTIKQELPWRMKGNPDSLLSTMSVLVTPCPHCDCWIAPERQHFTGWEDARTEDEAAEKAFFFCPECGEQITERERRSVNQDIKLIHHGQTIDEQGDITGPEPATSILWFRWTQFHNFLLGAEDHAIEEWRAQQVPDGTEEKFDSEKSMCQFVWCWPYDPPITEEIPLTPEDVLGRTESKRRGVLSTEAVRMSCGIDLRATQIHYTVIEWYANSAGCRIDFGIIPVDRKLGIRRGVLAALRILRDKILTVGYTDTKNRTLRPQVVFVDAGWKPEVTRAFVKEWRAMGFTEVYPAYGRGMSAPRGRGGYSHPAALTKNGVSWIGDQYYFKMQPKHGVIAAYVNSDEWKSFVHDGMTMDPGLPGSLLSFEPVTDDEIKLAGTLSRQTCAEKAIEIVVPDRGPVTVWRNESFKANHGLDVTYLACAAGHRAGVRVIDQVPQQQQQRPPQRSNDEQKSPYFASRD